MAAAVLSQIYVEPRIRNQDLIASLKDEGVRVGYPFCEVDMSSQEKLFRLQRIFEYYGWSLEVSRGYYEAQQNEEDIEI